MTEQRNQELNTRLVSSKVVNERLMFNSEEDDLLIKAEIKISSNLKCLPF